MAYKLKVTGDMAEIDEGAEDLLSKLIDGCRGEININTPFGNRKIKKIKKGGKVRDHKPEKFWEKTK